MRHRQAKAYRTKGKILQIAIAVILFLSFNAHAQYENQSYLPLTKKELGQRFPIKYVGTVIHGDPANLERKTNTPLPDRLNIGVSSTVVTKTEGEEDLIFKGEDKAHKPWSVQLGFNFECRFYESDLDHNGITDGLLVCPTGGNGLAPSRHLFAITFDEQGRPVTFEADGYFEETKDGLFDLVDLNHNGRAELIYMNFDDGYWITNMYEVKNARWQLVTGRRLSHVFPLYTRFTLRENHKATQPKPGRHPFAADLSNVSPNLNGYLMSYQWANVSSSEDIVLKIKDRDGKEVISKPTSWNSSFAVLIDGPEGRRVVSLSASVGTLQSLLKEIVERKYEVELFGRRKREQSSPELLIAHAR